MNSSTTSRERGAWCMVHGAWCMVHGAWCMVHGAWCMVHGAWWLFNKKKNFFVINSIFQFFVSLPFATRGATGGSLKTVESLQRLEDFRVMENFISFMKFIS